MKFFLWIFIFSLTNVARAQSPGQQQSSTDGIVTEDSVNAEESRLRADVESQEAVIAQSRKLKCQFSSARLLAMRTTEEQNGPVVTYGSVISNGLDLNVTSGIFKAPRRGFYHVDFRGTLNRQIDRSVTIHLLKNGKLVAGCHLATNSDDSYPGVETQAAVMMEQNDEIKVVTFDEPPRDNDAPNKLSSAFLTVLLINPI